MSRVIAVQEEQLNLLKENYSKNAPVASVVQNNANVLSESLGGNGVAISGTPIDMETQSVNMNAYSVPPIDPIVSNDATNEVFGVTADANILSSSFEQPTLTTINENTSLTSEDLPYQEPVLSNPAPVNVMSDEAFVKYINSLRNKLSDFMNEMNSKLDKLQEEFLSKTGANLLGADQVSGIKEEDPVIVQPVGETVSDVPVANIFDPNETLVTNNLIHDINEARGMVESGFSKAA